MKTCIPSVAPTGAFLSPWPLTPGCAASRLARGYLLPAPAGAPVSLFRRSLRSPGPRASIGMELVSRSRPGGPVASSRGQVPRSGTQPPVAEKKRKSPGRGDRKKMFIASVAPAGAFFSLAADPGQRRCAARPGLFAHRRSAAQAQLRAHIADWGLGLRASLGGVLGFQNCRILMSF